MKLTPLEPWIQNKITSNSEHLLTSDLEAYQLEQLRRTIQWGREKSRFYAKHLANAPQDISRLDDIALFPFTTAADLLREGKQFLCVSQSDIYRVVTLDTSGTMGEPKRIYFTRSDQELTIDFFHHGMTTFTEVGDRVIILLPCEKPGSVGDLLAMGLDRLGAVPIRYGPVHDPIHTLNVMQTEKVNGLVGSPVQTLTLARFWQMMGSPSDAKPSQVLLSTDHLPQAILNALESIWGCTVYNHYGMTEMGLGGGVECQARRGYHLREADLYFEIVEPRTGKPVPEGEQGEVIFTTLTRVGMPLIRYRTGDLSRFIPGRCPCGTSLRTLARITRRLDNLITFQKTDAIEVSNVNFTPSLCMADLDEALFPIPQVVNFSALISTQSNDTDLLEITIIVLPNTTKDITNQAHKALESIPVIQNARDAGLLDIQIKMQKFDLSMSGSMVKRVILDRRSRSQIANPD